MDVQGGRQQDLPGRAMTQGCGERLIRGHATGLPLDAEVDSRCHFIGVTKLLIFIFLGGEGGRHSYWTSCCMLLEVIFLRMTITDKRYVSLLACIVSFLIAYSVFILFIYLLALPVFSRRISFCFIYSFSFLFIYFFT